MISVLNILVKNIDENKNAYLSYKLLGKFISDKDKRINSVNPTVYEHISIFDQELVEKEKIVELFIKNFREFKETVKNMLVNKNWGKDIDLLPIDNFSYSQNLRARLNFVNILIAEDSWKISPDPIDFIYEILNDVPLSQKDTQEFYKWIKKLIEKNISYETEEKIFALFNDKICSDSKKCQDLSIQAFESYLRVFLDINKIKNFLEYSYMGVNCFFFYFLINFLN